MKFIIIIFTGLILSSCSTPEPYHTNSGMIMEGNAAEKSIALKKATSNAKKHCRQQKQSLHLLKRSVKYQGDVAESTHKTMNKVGKIADAVGSYSFLGGNKKALHTGSATHGLKDKNAYLAKVLFKCR